MNLIRTLFIHSFILTSANCLIAQHTFSICAVDTITGEAGSAGASCINNSVIISDVHRGVGVIHTQAQYHPSNQNFAKSLMDAGYSPKEIIDSMQNADAFLSPEVRQYGAVKIHNGMAQSAAFTGANCIDYKNHIIGRYYTIQGNILAGQHILDSMEARFLRAEGDIACRLMAAMQGANTAGADTRCLSGGNSSLSSFIRIAKPSDTTGTLFIDINIPSGPPGFEPIDSLQALFDLQHSCMSDTTINSMEIIAGDLKIYPNPAEGILLISGNLPHDAYIELFDTSGRKVLSEKIIYGKVDISMLQLSTYLCRISARGRTVYDRKVALD